MDEDEVIRVLEDLQYDLIMFESIECKQTDVIALTYAIKKLKEGGTNAGK